ncbi:hypothetical protein [Paracraurococcus lichenis]|uniref:Uncharacterized protein n=1 Tax=Paracraurococcus lichenis TaxID=3064888 RepID=A0ABT9E3K6_9PROT|nr:hypothetical protein [Paracraurococcus sp. LOR1-02]MDO9710751.1 hypothetical protein [Paracraurococcus sp. LOR1-02]
MTASRAAAAALAALLLTAPGMAAAQPSQPQGQPAPRAGATARPNAGLAGPGLAPLQTEPGDVWAEVRSWTEKRGRPAAAAPSAPAPKARRAEACPAGTPADDPACAPRPARRRPSGQTPG